MGQSLNIENPRLYSKQEESTIQLCKMLQVNSSLRELNLAKHQIRDYGARILASNRISDDGAFAFGAALRHPDTQLVKIDLSKNSIGDEGLVAVASGMEQNQVLTQLRLW